ncbi:MAG: guanylate kinase [Nitrospirae bacterium]|nr:MAG: guanylate kinase [Nitrospirota bacterium]
MRKGVLFVISAPSGAGKTTLCLKLSEVFPEIRHSVSYTTRKPREGEADGVHYFFTGKQDFLGMIERGEFLEWAEVHGNYYGTSREFVSSMVSSGTDLLLDIDVQGGREIRKHFQDSVLIFILPPSKEALRQRLEGRMSDPAEVIERRLKIASDEISGYKNYNYVIVNDKLEQAFDELVSIITAERLKTERVDGLWIKEQFLKEDKNGY